MTKDGKLCGGKNSSFHLKIRGESITQCVIMLVNKILL